MKDDDLARTLQEALGAHFAWKTRLRRAVDSQAAEVTVDSVRRDDCCVLGKLLHHELPGDQRSGDHYGPALDLHRQFHLTAADALGLALAGKGPEATAIIDGRFSELSAALGAVLMKWRQQAMKG